MLKVAVKGASGGGGEAGPSSALPTFKPSHFSLHPALKDSPGIG